MPYILNPFTGEFDLVSSGSSGGSSSPGSVFWVKALSISFIDQWHDNFVTNPMIIDGTLIIDGRLSIYG